MTLKTQFQRILAYVHSPPMQKSHRISEGYWIKVHQHFSRKSFFIVDVNATIRVAIRPPVVEWEGRHLKK